MSKDRIVWKKEPEADDYSGTLNFLSLIFPAPKCKKLLRDLRAEATIDRAASDTAGNTATSTRTIESTLLLQSPQNDLNDSRDSSS